MAEAEIIHLLSSLVVWCGFQGKVGAKHAKLFYKYWAHVAKYMYTLPLTGSGLVYEDTTKIVWGNLSYC